MAKMDYYEILNVAKDATPEEIKLAWRKLVRALHPDHQQDEDKEASAEVFKRVKEAYEVLSDPDKRHNYDTYGKGDIDIREDVKQTVLSEFNGLLQTPDVEVWTPDIFEAMRRSLRNKVSANLNQVKQAEKDIARMAKLAKRIVVKGEGAHNVFLDLTNQRTQKAHEFIKGALLANLVLEGAVKYLDDFSDQGREDSLGDALDGLFAGTVSNQYRLT